MNFRLILQGKPSLQEQFRPFLIHKAAPAVLPAAVQITLLCGNGCSFQNLKALLCSDFFLRQQMQHLLYFIVALEICLSVEQQHSKKEQTADQTAQLKKGKITALRSLTFVMLGSFSITVICISHLFKFAFCHTSFLSHSPSQ